MKTQLDQYTGLDEEQKTRIEVILPTETLQEFRSSYIETSKQPWEIQQKNRENTPPEIQQLDFEFVLFASAVIDYDYIMNLIADSIPSEYRASRKFSHMASLPTSKINSLFPSSYPHCKNVLRKFLYGMLYKL